MRLAALALALLAAPVVAATDSVPPVDFLGKGTGFRHVEGCEDCFPALEEAYCTTDAQVRFRYGGYGEADWGVATLAIVEEARSREASCEVFANRAQLHHNALHTTKDPVFYCAVHWSPRVAYDQGLYELTYENGCARQEPETYYVRVTDRVLDVWRAGGDAWARVERVP